MLCDAGYSNIYSMAVYPNYVALMCAAGYSNIYSMAVYNNYVVCCRYSNIYSMAVYHNYIVCCRLQLHYPSDVEASVNAIKHNKTYNKDVHILNKEIKKLNT
jgi:hypothetical protein